MSHSAPSAWQAPAPEPTLRCEQTQAAPELLAAKALGIAHKSERGAVRLDLRGREQIAAAAAELLLLGDGCSSSAITTLRCAS